MATSRPASRQADVVVERSVQDRSRCIRAISSRTPASPACRADGRASCGCCTQGHFIVRDVIARSCSAWTSRKLRVTASEIGGGFGGKTDRLHRADGAGAVAQGRPAGEDGDDAARRCSAPPARPPATIDRRQDRRHEGRHASSPPRPMLQLPGRRLRRARRSSPAPCAPSPATTSRTSAPSATTWSSTGRRSRPTARPVAPMAAFAVESVIDELARKIGMDPIDLRLKNAAKRGHQGLLRPDLRPDRPRRDAGGGQEPSAYDGAARQEPGARRRLRLLVQLRRRDLRRRSTSTTTARCRLTVGTPDIGGSRASMCMMAAEELGIPYDKVRVRSSPTPSSLGYNDVTDGSRVTFSTGMATVDAARDAIKKLCARAAKMWDIPEEAVVWEKRLRQAGRPQCRQVPAAVAQGDRRRRRPAPAGRSPAITRSTPTAPASSFATHIATSRSTARPAATRSCATR